MTVPYPCGRATLALMKKSILFVLMLALAGCSRSGSGPAGMADQRPATMAKAAADSKPGDQAARRFLALRHQLTLLVPAATLARDFDAIQADCIKLGCEILSAEQQADGPNQNASARLSARLPPAAFAGFFQGVTSHGKLLSHRSESEDKTAEVIDIEARIKNLEALKARVLQLLAKNSGNLKEILEAEKELADTQTTLDSINGQRRALANLTEMTRVDIELRPQSLQNEDSWAAPLVTAARESGTVLTSSLAFLLTTSVALLPWALALGLLFIPVRRLWRRRRAGNSARAAAEK